MVNSQQLWLDAVAPSTITHKRWMGSLLNYRLLIDSGREEIIFSCHQVPVVNTDDPVKLSGSQDKDISMGKRYM